MLKKYFVGIAFLFLFPILSFAQSSVLLGNLKLEADVYAAKIFKHTPNFKPNTNQLVGGVELRLLRQTFGSKEWHSNYHFPLCGVQLSYVNFNDKHLGDAFAIAPCIQFNFIQTPKTKIFFGLADGLAYFSKKYNRLTDTINNAMSTTINEMTQFKLGASFQLPNKALLTTSLSFTHYSNAKINAPNLGVNVYALHIGYQNFISTTPKNFRPVAAINYSSSPKFTVQLGYARTATIPYGGPKMPYYVALLSIDKRWCYSNRWKAGLWYEYNKGAYLNANYYEPNDNASAVANKVAVVLSDEFVLGKMSFGGSFGYYLYRGKGGEEMFQNLHINYVLWSWNKEKMRQIYCGAQLKTYLGVAEYFETYIGCRL
jgi:hypothetical protein